MSTGVEVLVVVGVGVELGVSEGVYVGVGELVAIGVDDGVNVGVAEGVGVAVAFSTQLLGCPPQLNPDSTSHTEEQPSPLVRFPSSHCSPESMVVLPHN